MGRVDDRTEAAARLATAIVSGDIDAIEDAEAAEQAAWEAYDADTKEKSR